MFLRSNLFIEKTVVAGDSNAGFTEEWVNQSSNPRAVSGQPGNYQATSEHQPQQHGPFMEADDEERKLLQIDNIGSWTNY